MQFDILNELLTSTVSDLFRNTQTTTSESRQIVKQLQSLIRNDPTRRSSSVDSNISLSSGFGGMNTSGVSESSNKGSNAGRQTPLRHCKNAPRRLKESIQKLGITEELLKKKQDLDAFVSAMSIDKLAADKKKVKNQLRMYDSDFYQLFHNQPNHDEKQPFRPLYIYYKKLKEYINAGNENNLTPEQLQRKIRELKAQRKDLRVRIQNYQREFENTNNRRIKYERDIAPIKTEYARYKDLKNQLLRLDQMLTR